MMAVSLYTSRVVLNALGVEDFGIYNVVGGVVMMFTIISASLSSSISRFITYELGKGDTSKLRKIFSASLTIQLLLSLIIVILIESFGVWFLNTKMTIPTNRLIAANWTLQFSIITFVINLISVPYNATIIAHESMSAFAYISILEALSKLAIAFLITISPIDKLVFYAILMCSVAIIIRLVYGYYCKKHFEECNYHFYWDMEILKKMFGFAGWNFIGASAGVLRTQGTNILLNIYFDPMVNAARGIAVQVNNAISSFSNNFLMAVNPQIIKSYATNDMHHFKTLVCGISKYSYFLMLILAIPIFLNMDFILTLWLKNPPPHSTNFAQLILIFCLVDSLSGPLWTSMQATGKIKNYLLITSFCLLLNLPIAYFALWIGSKPESIIIVGGIGFKGSDGV